MESDGRLAMEVMMEEYRSSVDPHGTGIPGVLPFAFGYVRPLCSNLFGFDGDALGGFRKIGLI
ncbi:hypothetical protein Scep_014623 [Stephania cephalantha]|uniref:Uncharacterized protein n=1 Tax=Stephania cephalantha TaxID=152367 RepID=A0AAP0J3P0_9MAGN